MSTGRHVPRKPVLEPDHGGDAPQERSRQERSRVLKRARTPTSTPTSEPTAAPAQTSGTLVPLPVIVISLVIAGLVVALTWLLLPKQPSAPPAPKAGAVDTVAAPDTGLDVRWRGNRQDNNDCVGTFEVTRGGGTPAQFTAFMLDSAGGVVARDSARVGSAVRGLLVEFRFHRIDCKAIADWQLQVATPKPAPTQARD